jgi:hypothetical protein
VQISDLLSVSVSVPPREIERFLDALAKLPWSINPTLRYEDGLTHIEFPAWRGWLDELHTILAAGHFDTAKLRYTPAVGGMRKSNA